MFNDTYLKNIIIKQYYYTLIIFNNKICDIIINIIIAE